MKLRHLIFVIFVYTIPESFDVSGFLISCKANGIKLYAETETDSPHGYISAGGGKLTVTLYEKAAKALPPDMKKNFRGRPGNAVLPGVRAKNKSLIDSAVSASQL